MFKKFIGMAVAAMLLLGVFGLTACNSPEKIEMGFGGRGVAGKFNNFFCGAKSENVVFDVNEINIDFYFGWANIRLSNVNGISNSTPDWTEIPAGYERVAIAAYFYGYNGIESEQISENENSFIDYRNIENRYFIKEFAPDDFFTDKYKATFTSSGLFGSNKKTEFNYYESMKIPSDILSCESGSFYFGIIDILFSQEKNHYIFGYQRTLWDDVRFRYEQKGNGQITIKGYAQK